MILLIFLCYVAQHVEGRSLSKHAFVKMVYLEQMAQFKGAQ